MARIRPDVTASSRRSRGPLRADPVFKGIAHVLHDVQYREGGRVTRPMVIRWRPGLPQKRDRPWYLMTDLAGRAESLRQPYACRMGAEEPCRGRKDRRNGWALRGPRIRYADRFERLLLIPALTSLLCSGPGLQATPDFEPSQRYTGTRDGECSAFTIGKAMRGRWSYDPGELVRRVRYATEDAARWG